MENRANDETIPCPNYCGKEISTKNIEDHLKSCPLQVVECGWCGLKQSRNVFKEHIILANPETEINNVQQCMQRQCDHLSKQQIEFRNHIKKQDDTIKRLSDDIQNKDGVIQKLLNDLTQQNKDINSKFQRCITWNTSTKCIGLLLIINFIFVLCHHYWLQSQQAVPHYKTMAGQTDTILLADSFSNEFCHEELTEMKTKYNKIVQDLTEMKTSFTKTAEIATSRSEVNGQIVQLNQSILNRVKEWQKQMEKRFTKTADLGTFRSKINDQMVQLNQSILNEAKQWQKQMDKRFTKTADLGTFRSKINDQMVQLNQSILNGVKEWQKQMEKRFTKTADLGTFRSKINDQMVQLNQSILNGVKEWQKQMEKRFTKTADLGTFRSKINDQMVQLNQSMFNAPKQWQKQFKEMIENCTKTITSEIHKLKMNHSNIIIMDEIKCPLLVNNACKVIQEQIHKNIELKVGHEQSTKTMFENIELTGILPVTFTMSNFNEKMENTEQWYGSPFFVFNGGYLMNLEVHPSGYGRAKGTHVSLFLRLMKGPHDDQLQQSGHWPLRGTFTVKLLNAFSDNVYYTRKVTFSTYNCNTCTKRVIDNNVNDGWGLSQFISHDMIQQSSCNENLYFNISYADTNPSIPCDLTAPVTLRMPKVNEMIKNKGQWYSRPFFAFEGGYQMCLKVYTGGYHTGEGTHLSVFIHLMKGPHDDKLLQLGHFPLKGTFNITLLNLFSDHHHHSKYVTFSMCNCDECVQKVVNDVITVGCGKEKFLSLYDISDYLKSNSLVFEIIYEDINPPDPDETAQAYSFGLYAPYYVVVSILYAVKECLVYVAVVICTVVYYVVYKAFVVVVLILYAAHYVVVNVLYAVKECLVFAVVICVVVCYVVCIAFVFILYTAYYVIESILHVLYSYIFA